jgi:hypothetical protein
MPRVFFPTTNNLGVRDLKPVQTLGVYRAPAEPDPHPAMNPVNLGLVRQVIDANGSGWAPPYYNYRIATEPPPTAPRSTPMPAGPFAAPPAMATAPAPAPAAALPAPPPVSTQNSPTPQVSAPPPPVSSGAILVTSGGGTVSPNTNPPATPGTTISVSSAAPTDITGQIAAWLSGATTLFGYSVPNAILAGAVILGFAALSGGGKKR